MSVENSNAPLAGLWQPLTSLRHLYYGSGCVERYLLKTLPSLSSKVVIVTGTSLATKTPLVRQLETLLGDRHAGTVSEIRQHGPVADVEQAVETVLSRVDVDTVVSLGGGSPIDIAKVISLRARERRGALLTHITIPTTLSAAECTAGGGFTNESGTKVGFRDPGMGVSAILYDPKYAHYTPKDLWLSTGMRALDHAVECMYHPYSSEVPWKVLSLWAVSELFECLPRAQDLHPHDESISLRLMLAAYASSGLKGENIKGGMGLSHSLGHELGSPYDIPHGITSCMTLGKVVKLKAQQSSDNAKQISRLLPATGGHLTDDNLRDALEVGNRIIDLVRSLGLEVGTLSTRGVDKKEGPMIVRKALGGIQEGPLYNQVTKLVDTLF